MLAPLRFYYLLCYPVEYHKALIAVLNETARYNKHRCIKRRDSLFPVPAQSADFPVTATGIERQTEPWQRDGRAVP